MLYIHGMCMQRLGMATFGTVMAIWCELMQLELLDDSISCAGMLQVCKNSC